MQIDLTKMRKGHFVIEPTFQCNVCCDHCVHESSWERRERMPLELFRSCINQALKQGWTTICVSGGEPFLLPDYIRAAAELCFEQGVDLVIQTNGFWGQNPVKARKMLQNMTGITQIGFSVDKVHLKEIGLEPVLHAIKATIEAGIHNVSASIAYQTNLEFQILKEQFTSRFPGFVVEGWPILPVGRAKNHPELRVDCLVYPWDQLKRNCDVQIQLRPVVHPNGSLHFCYQIVMALEEKDPLQLGNLNEYMLADLLGNVQNRLLMFMIAYGGGGLGYLLHKSPYEGLLHEKYQTVCHFCHEILSRPKVVAYLQELLAEEAFELRIMEGINRAYEGWKEDLDTARERILICNGPSCGRNHQNRPIMYYLLNKLFESNKAHLAKVELVNCINSCGTGPNLYLERQNKLVQHVDLETIDYIVKEIGHRRCSDNSPSL